MSNQKASDTTNNGLSLGEQAVADYLRRHPGFFEDKPGLLTDLRVPHAAGTAVSLVERQVAVLRDNNARLQEQLEGLIQVAHENDALNGLLHTFTLQVIQCESMNDLLSLVDKKLRRDFSADLVALRLFTCPGEGAEPRSEYPEDPDALCGQFRRLLTSGKPYCGQLSDEQLGVLFGEQAESVASSALLPLGSRGGLGLLVIGSVERDRYHSGMDTSFLARLAGIISAALGRHLDDA